MKYIITSNIDNGNRCFAVLIYRSLMRPVKFNEVYEARKAAVIEKLKNIRDLQAYYKMEKALMLKMLSS